MERRPVASSQINSIGYDAGSRKLEVEFTSKGNPVYEYENVEMDHFTRLTSTDKNSDGTEFSVGRYFGQTVKADPKKYPYKKLGNAADLKKPK